MYVTPYVELSQANSKLLKLIIVAMFQISSFERLTYGLEYCITALKVEKFSGY